MTLLPDEYKQAATDRWTKKKRKNHNDYDHGEDGMVSGNPRYGKKGKRGYSGHPKRHRNAV